MGFAWEEWVIEFVMLGFFELEASKSHFTMFYLVNLSSATANVS